jgi:putative transposase
LQFAAKKHSKNEFYKVWQDGNHAIAIYSEKFAWQKLNYIHWNPVVDMLVDKPEDYLFSSARNYTDRSTLLPVILLTPPVLTSDKPGFFRVNHE